MREAWRRQEVVQRRIAVYWVLRDGPGERRGTDRVREWQCVYRQFQRRAEAREGRDCACGWSEGVIQLEVRHQGHPQEIC